MKDLKVMQPFSGNRSEKAFAKADTIGLAQTNDEGPVRMIHFPDSATGKEKGSQRSKRTKTMSADNGRPKEAFVANTAAQVRKQAGPRVSSEVSSNSSRLRSRKYQKEVPGQNLPRYERLLRREEHRNAQRHNEENHGRSRPSDQTRSATPRSDNSSTRDSPTGPIHPLKPLAEQEEWRIRKAALQEKFSNSPWNPPKKLSPDAMEGVRALHDRYPDHFTVPILAAQFKISPEAIRRILKSRWKPRNVEEEEDRLRRWDRRGERIWTGLVERGVHPPKNGE